MKILVVDDEVELAQGYSEWLKKAGHQVTTLNDGENAWSAIEDGNFQAVISDIRMPKLNGMELLKHVADKHLPVRVVLITGFSEYDAAEIISMGGAGFLAKPVRKDELIECIQGLSQSTATDPSGLKFSRIAMDSFVIGRKSPFAIYLRLRDGAFIKVCSADRELELTRLHKFKDHGVNELWVESSQLPKYLEIIATLKRQAAHFVANKKAEKADSALTRSLLESAIEGMKAMGINDQSIRIAAVTVKESFAQMTKSDEWLRQMIAIQSAPAAISESASLGASLLGGVAKLMGWKSPKSIHSLILGAYMRDLALIQHANLLSKERVEMTEDERVIYLQHPIKGADDLSRIQGLPREVVMIVAQHHEIGKHNGGFPLELRIPQVFPMARMVAAVDMFLSSVRERGNLQELEEGQVIELLKTLERESPDHHTTVALVALATKKNVHSSAEFFNSHAYGLGVRIA